MHSASRSHTTVEYGSVAVLHDLAKRIQLVEIMVINRVLDPNGKLERCWYEYDRHRWRFGSIDEFIAWYNARLHGDLLVAIGECPGEAVYRKLQPGILLGLFMGWSE